MAVVRSSSPEDSKAPANPFAAGAALVDGEIVPIEEARVPITDMGFARSDVTYDVVAVWEGAFFRLDAHLGSTEACTPSRPHTRARVRGRAGRASALSRHCARAACVLAGYLSAESFDLNWIQAKALGFRPRRACLRPLRPRSAASSSVTSWT
jgi:hypothetical protein